MELQDAIDLGIQQITHKLRHPDYARTVKLAEQYLALSTGEGVDKMLRRFVKRESEEDFAMRCEITESITQAVTETLELPWNKVIRNERIKKGLEVSSPTNEQKVKDMIDSFFGANRDTANKGLEYWLKTRFKEITFADPNTWVAIEWKAVSLNEVPRPYPFEIPAVNALNFSVVNDETQWLFCDQAIMMRTSTKAEGKMAPGTKFTLYDRDYTVVFEQVDKRLVEANGVTIDPNFQKLEKIGALHYVFSWFTPMVGYVPAFRMGYKTDRATNSRTFINPWHKALAYLKKSLKTVSELDLTMTYHAFPQKLQYAYPCPGPNRDEKCRKGYLKDESTCPACKGVGYKFHTSANDAMILAMPAEGTPNSEIMDLEKLIAYKSPPVDLIRWQNDYILQLKAECTEAVFTSLSPMKKAGGAAGAASPGGGSGQAGTATATEIDTNMQGIYDSLEPFTEKGSEIYREFVTVFAILSGEQAKNVKVIYNFPADFKLKTTDILLDDLKKVNDSSAPSFLRDAINMDLAENVYSGDDLGLLKYRTKRKFFPFNGKSIDEIQFLLSSSFVDKREKVLYANFESIFQEIETENPEFYVLTTMDAQFVILEAKLAEWIAALDATSAAAVNNAMRQSNPVNPPVDNNPANA